MTITYVKDRETFVFRYDPADEAAAIEAVCELAERGESGFCLMDAAAVLGAIARKGTVKA